MVWGVDFYRSLSLPHAKTLRHDSPNKTTEAHAGEFRWENGSDLEGHSEMKCLEINYFEVPF